MRFIAMILVVWAMAFPAQAQEDPIQGVISDQLEAFKEDDFAKAFSFASPFIRQMFGTSDRFGMMVRNGYPMVWRPADVTYVDQEQRGPLTYQTVRIRDEDGAFHYLEYEMVPFENSFQINGVRFIPAPDVAA